MVGISGISVILCAGGHLESQANAQVFEAAKKGLEDYFGADGVLVAPAVAAPSAILQAHPKFVMALGSYLPESTYYGEIAREARKVGAKTIFWATEDPYEHDAHYQITDDFDLIFSCDSWATRFYQGKTAHHMPLGASREHHYLPYVPEEEKNIDVLFCGVAFSSRKQLVRTLMPTLERVRIRFIGPGWGAFGPGFSDERIDKAHLIHLYGGSKIVLNLGRSLHFENRRFMISPTTPGPRTFEAALAGAFQLFHEDTHELQRYYPPDEMAVFTTPRDFAEALKKYLPNPQLREKMARKAQERTLKEHLYTHRIHEMLKKAETLLEV